MSIFAARCRQNHQQTVYPPSTLNPADKDSSLTLSDGNLVVTKGGSDYHCIVRSTRGLSSGKWYWEVQMTASMPNSREIAAITTSSAPLNQEAGGTVYGYGYNGINGQIYHNGGPVSSFGGGPNFDVGQRVMFAFDADAGEFWVGLLGSWIFPANPATGINPSITGIASGTWFPTIDMFDVGGAAEIYFSTASQTYAPPSGFSSVG